MNVFPQLSSLTMCQFPYERSSIYRTAANLLLNLGAITYSDPGGHSIEWRLRLRDLDDNERAALEALFNATHGMLDTFTFLDPMDNLLVYSEDFTAGSWAKDPGIVLMPGVPDPLGTVRATRVMNTAQAPGRLYQTANIAGWFYYTFSLHLRSSTNAVATLLLGPASTPAGKQHAAGQAWERILHSGKVASQEQAAVAGVELAPGGEVDLFGCQMEAQLTASEYKKTAAAGGIYTRARFAHDELTWTTTGAGQHSTNLTVVSQ